MELNDYEQKLLRAWEDVHKMGQLTLWIMLALKAGPKHMADIKHYIQSATDGVVLPDDQSLYRSLRRYFDAEMIDYQFEPGSGGAERKVYRLTDIGSNVLKTFTARNITSLLNNPILKKLQGVK